MTESNDRPPISLATERKARERDFSQERADLLAELREIGVKEADLESTVQHVMFVEWAVYKAALMLEYHGVDQDAQAVVRLAEIMARNRDGR
jgi:hypothetical protein